MQVVTAATPTTFAFQLRDTDGAARQDFLVEHDVPLHLIVVRRDLTGFQHLHPTVDATGTWTTELTLPKPSAYRPFVDAVVPGDTDQPPTARTLSADVLVPGSFKPAALPAPAPADNVGEYTVRLDDRRGPGGTATLRFTIEHAGRPATDLQPYLGALGHLVALCAGDLAYLHVHPEDAVDAGPTVEFSTTFPSPGDYVLFLQIAHRDAIVTTAFIVHVSDTGRATIRPKETQV